MLVLPLHIHTTCTLVKTASVWKQENNKTLWIRQACRGFHWIQKVSRNRKTRKSFEVQNRQWRGVPNNLLDYFWFIFHVSHKLSNPALLTDRSEKFLTFQNWPTSAGSCPAPNIQILKQMFKTARNLTSPIKHTYAFESKLVTNVNIFYNDFGVYSWQFILRKLENVTW